MEVFKKDDRKYFAWLVANPEGFVVNTRPEAGSDYKTAHRVSCRYISGQKSVAHPTNNYIKLCANDPRELVHWFENHKKNFDGIFHQCTACDPQINDLINGKEYVSPDEVEDEKTYPEGAVMRVQVNAYERNSTARKRCIAHHGCICAVCEINFSDKYGKLGSGFIHVHHRRELSSIKAPYNVDPIKDLIPVCPNCHAMLHREKSVSTIEQLKEIVKIHCRER